MLSEKATLRRRIDFLKKVEFFTERVAVKERGEEDTMRNQLKRVQAELVALSEEYQTKFPEKKKARGKKKKS